MITHRRLESVRERSAVEQDQRLRLDGEVWARSDEIERPPPFSFGLAFEQVRSATWQNWSKMGSAAIVGFMARWCGIRRKREAIQTLHLRIGWFGVEVPQHDHGVARCMVVDPPSSFRRDPATLRLIGGTLKPLRFAVVIDDRDASPGESCPGEDETQAYRVTRDREWLQRQPNTGHSSCRSPPHGPLWLHASVTSP